MTKIKTTKVNPDMNKKPESKSPVFCFRYLQTNSIQDCEEHDFFYDFLFRLKQLGELDWATIDKTQRHGFGYEKLPVEQIKPKNLPPIVTADVKNLIVFRASGDQRPFLGIRRDNIFHVIFIESRFGDIYNH